MPNQALKNRKATTLRHSSALMTLLALMAAVFAFSACSNGCGEGTSDEEERVQALEEEEAATPLRQQVVAVARLKAFNERHFDLRQWRNEAIDRGLITARPGESIGEMPTTAFRLFVEDLLGPQAERIRWDGHVDFVVWQPEKDGEPWRWAVSLPRTEGAALESEVDWAGEGRFRVGDGAGAEAVTVFVRSPSTEPEKTYYVSEYTTPVSAGSTVRGKAVTISNFAKGAARHGEAVALTGESGARDGELYLWPRRSGITERYLMAAEILEQRMATSGHNLLPARVGLFQLQAQLYRTLGSEQSWPEVMRISLQTDRNDRGARRATVSADLHARHGMLFPALWSSMRETNLEAGPQVNDAIGKVGLVLRPREISTLSRAAVPEPWLQLMSVRSAGTRQLLIEEFNQLLLHNRGPTTLAFYSGHQRSTAEFFVGFQAIDRDEIDVLSRRFHHRLLRDFWMPIFDVTEFARDETRQERFSEQDVAIHEITFRLPHGGQEVGVCWTIRGREYLSYYGVHPCERLRAVSERPEERRAGPALHYGGSLAALLDKVFVLPDESLGHLFRDLDVDIWAQRFSQQRMEFTSIFADPAQLAAIVEDVPKLARHWSATATLDPAELVMELSLQQATYQEPGLAALLLPGMAPVLPPSYLLGLPFSFGPTPPILFRRVYFEEPEHEHHH